VAAAAVVEVAAVGAALDIADFSEFVPLLGVTFLRLLRLTAREVISPNTAARADVIAGIDAAAVVDDELILSVDGATTIGGAMGGAIGGGGGALAETITLFPSIGGAIGTLAPMGTDGGGAGTFLRFKDGANGIAGPELAIAAEVIPPPTLAATAAAAAGIKL